MKKKEKGKKEMVIRQDTNVIHGDRIAGKFCNKSSYSKIHSYIHSYI